MAENKNNVALIYSLGGALLISLVTEIVTMHHYWRQLSGVALTAVVGILFVTWTQIWTTAWAVSDTQDLRVKRVSYGASLFVTLAMIANAGFILATRNQENKEDVKIRQENAKLQSQTETLKGLDPEVAKEIIKQQEAEKQREWEEKRKAQVVSATGRKEETSLGDIAAGYMSFWVFVVPFAVAALAKFLVLAMIALPGGASGYMPVRKKADLEGPRPMREPENIMERIQRDRMAAEGRGLHRPKL